MTRFVTRGARETETMQQTIRRINELEILQDLPLEYRARLMEKSVAKNHPKRTVLIQQGDAFPGLFALERGMLLLSRADRFGGGAIVRLVHPGESFGLPYLVGTSVAPFSLTTSGDCGVVFIDRATCIDVLGLNDPCTKSILGDLLRTKEELYVQLQDVKSHAGTRRLGWYLLRASEKTGNTTIPLPMERLELASYLGMAPESLSRSFRVLSKSGVASTRGSAMLFDKEALIAFLTKDR